MNDHQIQALRTTGEIAGSVSLFSGLVIMYALSRLLTSPTKSNDHHPKLTGTHTYFILLLVSVSALIL